MISTNKVYDPFQIYTIIADDNNLAPELAELFRSKTLVFFVCKRADESDGDFLHSRVRLPRRMKEFTRAIESN
jgi:hypothetical protein